MQILLANPAWLWLLSLAVVPVLVHLFARSNPPKFAFSNTEFLRRIIKKTARMRKPQDWLLLLLRTLAVLALLFVFLQPLLTSRSTTLGNKKTTIFLIDRSASMACKDGADSRFANACQKATELLDAHSTDAANVIWIDADPDGLFPQPGPNLDYLQEQLKRSEVHHELGSLSTAIQLAVSQLNQVQGERELVILSDFQSSAWKNVKLQVPKSINVVKLKVGTKEVENIAITELFSSPSSPVVGQDVLMVCRLHNYSSTPRATTLYLEFNGGRQSRDVEIPAWGEAEVNFKTRFSRAGLLSLNASIAEDLFPADDSRHAIVHVKEALKLVSVLPPEKSIFSQEPQVLKRLASAFDWLDTRLLHTGKLPAAGTADYVWVHAWMGQDIKALRALAKSGTTVIVQPTAGCSLADCQALLGLKNTQQTAPIAVDTKGKWKATISQKANKNLPVFGLFQSGEFGNPAEGIFHQRLHLPSDWQTGGVQRYLDYQDGVLGVIASKKNTSSAPIFLWNLPMSGKLSDWSSHASFVPWMGEFLINSRALHHNGGFEVLPGSPLTWLLSDQVSPTSVKLYNSKGTLLKTTIKTTERGNRIMSEQPATLGTYFWNVGDSVAFKQVVNFPVEESDLRQMDPSEVQGGEVVDTKSLLRRTALGEGISLWPWLVAACLLFLLGESLVSLWNPKPSDDSHPPSR